jgi:hypothetical protein
VRRPPEPTIGIPILTDPSLARTLEHLPENRDACRQFPPCVGGAFDEADADPRLILSADTSHKQFTSHRKKHFLPHPDKVVGEVCAATGGVSGAFWADPFVTTPGGDEFMATKIGEQKSAPRKATRTSSDSNAKTEAKKSGAGKPKSREAAKAAAQTAPEKKANVNPGAQGQGAAYSAARSSQAGGTKGNNTNQAHANMVLMTPKVDVALPGANPLGISADWLFPKSAASEEKGSPTAQSNINSNAPKSDNSGPPSSTGVTGTDAAAAAEQANIEAPNKRKLKGSPGDWVVVGRYRNGQKGKERIFYDANEVDTFAKENPQLNISFDIRQLSDAELNNETYFPKTVRESRELSSKDEAIQFLNNPPPTTDFPTTKRTEPSGKPSILVPSSPIVSRELDLSLYDLKGKPGDSVVTATWKDAAKNNKNNSKIFHRYTELSAALKDKELMNVLSDANTKYEIRKLTEVPLNNETFLPTNKGSQSVTQSEALEFLKGLDQDPQG